ncbi:hypothetical protein [Limosilactobacillus agrestis]|nr:hypothetical protein [Limosilactobacillus agrestis]
MDKEITDIYGKSYKRGLLVMVLMIGAVWYPACYRITVHYERF